MQGRAPLVLLTDDHTRGGWSSVLQRNPFFVERATEELIKQGRSGGEDKNRSRSCFEHSRRSIAHKRLCSGTGASVHFGCHFGLSFATRAANLRQTFAGTGTTIGLEPVPRSQTPSPAFWWLQPRRLAHCGHRVCETDLLLVEV